MFSQAFYIRVDAALSAVHDLETISLSALGRCIAPIAQYLAEAEVDDAAIRRFTDAIFDCFAADRERSGRQLAGRIRVLLDEMPGLGDRADRSWADAMPAAERCGDGHSVRWDMKELHNRVPGSNRASLSRLRRALGMSGELRVSGAVDLRHRRRFKACGSMQMTDRHDVQIDGEQINRLIRYLGWGDPGTDPHGGRPALLA